MTVREYLCHFPLPALASCSLSYSPLSFPNLSSIVCRSFFSLAVSGGRAAAISVRFISRSMRGVDRRFAAEATLALARGRGRGGWRDTSTSSLAPFPP